MKSIVLSFRPRSGLLNCVVLPVVMALFLANITSAQIAVDFSAYQTNSPIQVRAKDADTLQITWPTSPSARGEMLLDLRPDATLIQSLGWTEKDQPPRIIATKLDPVTTLTIGERDKKKYDEAFRGMVFFENPRQKPYQTHLVKLTKTKARVFNTGPRVTVCIGDVSAGSFQGELRFTFYPNSSLLQAETVLRTTEELRAIIYDTGLSSTAPDWNQMVWQDSLGNLRREPVNATAKARPLAVKQRTIVAEGQQGSLAILPAPHRYFYPLDFADNFEFNWIGTGYSQMPAGFGFGIRQPPDGDKRWVPWFAAPPNEDHHLNVFYLLSPADGKTTLDAVARYTHSDSFKKLPGHHTFTSHYHIEHTIDYIEQQKRQRTTGIPKGLETPGFVTKFKETGVDIVHLAEFHHGWTPGQKTAERLVMQKVMHEECERLSDKNFLLLPGEEPNVHLGGHWISFFPKPVYWVLNRAANEPFEENIPGYGTVYRVGNPADVLKLMEKENGLMWTAHARIKGSIKFPDDYRNEPFYKSDHFLGAAWKSLPADLSRSTLGWRVLDLLDDMNQWGQRKQILGEVDVFKVEPDYELYAHMNINYLRLPKIPRYQDSWQPILDVLRGGKFFTTTGEILIPQFTVAGKESGATIAAASNQNAELIAQLDWTFPLAYAEIIFNDGKSVRRQRIDLADTESFSTRTVRLPVDVKGQKSIRFEVWDIAGNGAFTQPVWIE